MGKNLSAHHHVGFFVSQMNRMKNIVASVVPIPDADDYLYQIKRHKGFSPVIVHLSDAYKYGRADYDARPTQIKRGAFVLIAMPHAFYDEDLADEAVNKGIGIGHIGQLMSALNYADIVEARRRQIRERERKKS